MALTISLFDPDRVTLDFRNDDQCREPISPSEVPMFTVKDSATGYQQFERQLARRLARQTKGTSSSQAKQAVRSALVVILALGMGLLSACSNVREEVVSGKAEAQETKERTYVGHAKTRSLWAIEVSRN